MFFNAPGKPSSFKKAVYLAASTILGVTLSFIVHALIEINYINWVQSQDKIVFFYGACALPPMLQVTLWLAGAVGGWFLGRWWWRKVYIERVWAKRFRK